MYDLEYWKTRALRAEMKLHLSCNVFVKCRNPVVTTRLEPEDGAYLNYCEIHDNPNLELYCRWDESGNKLEG